LRRTEMGRTASIAALGVVALASGACDVGRGVMVDVRVDPSDRVLTAGGQVRAYWFDDADDALFAKPIDEQVRRVGEKRWNSVSRGNNQKDWVTAPIAADGSARLSLDTFYAGGAPVLHDLFATPREENPVGLVLEVVPTAANAFEARAFAVRDVDGKPTVVRVAVRGGVWTPDGAAGTVTVDGWHWRIELPVRLSE
jgi:hypothetical protein